jgi:hypothetical protein
MKAIALLFTLAILSLSKPALADCGIDAMMAAIEAPLDSVQSVERDASDVKSTEGADWKIYRDKDGRLNTIIRTDYGETFRLETRLSVVNRKDYIIEEHHERYSNPIGDLLPKLPGENEAVRLPSYRIIKTYFFFCGGRALVPQNYEPLPGEENFAAKAAELKRMMLDHPDIKEFTVGLVR